MTNENTDIDQFAASAFRMHDEKLVKKYDLEADDFVREQLGVDPSEYRFLALHDELQQLDSD
jgi:hypothetical protein